VSNDFGELFDIALLGRHQFSPLVRCERQFPRHRAGFTNTRGVLVSAVPSAGVGDPAPLLGGPGIEVMPVIVLTPAGQVRRGVAVAVSRVSAHTGEHPIGQCQVATDDPACRAEFARRVPAISYDEFSSAPGLLVAQQLRELDPARVRDRARQSPVAQHPGHIQVFDHEPVVGLDQLVRHLMQEMPTHVRNVVVMTSQLGCRVTAVM
jgi:hypothetical protein